MSISSVSSSDSIYELELEEALSGTNGSSSHSSQVTVQGSQATQATAAMSASSLAQGIGAAVQSSMLIKQKAYKPPF